MIPDGRNRRMHCGPAEDASTVPTESLREDVGQHIDPGTRRYQIAATVGIAEDVGDIIDRIAEKTLRIDR